MMDRIIRSYNNDTVIITQQVFPVAFNIVELFFFLKENILRVIYD